MIEIKGSSAFTLVTFDDTQSKLTVHYTGGAIYHFQNVTKDEVESIQNAPSKGRQLALVVTNKPFTKETVDTK